MRQATLYRAELALLALGSLAIVAVSLAYSPGLPPAEVDGIEVVGEGAIAVAFLVVVAAVYRFRSSFDAEVYHPFVLGFTFLYFSALLDFIDEFVAVQTVLTYAVENAGGVLGALSIALAFSYWVKHYEERGQTLTEQEERLRQRNEQLELLNRIVRHDIRNDLTVVRGMTELAEKHVDDEGAEYLEKAQRSTADAIDLTVTARDFVETVNDDGERELKPVPIQAVVTGQIERTSQAYPEADIRFESDLDSEIEVLADDMLSTVFRNLLVNAIQHNDKDVPHITVSVEENDGTVQIEVADNGPGIPMERRESVFECGEKGLESTGTGIGLYLVHTLLNQFDGEIDIDDGDPEGTVARVHLRRV